MVSNALKRNFAANHHEPERARQDRERVRHARISALARQALRDPGPARSCQ